LQRRIAEVLETYKQQRESLRAAGQAMLSAA
jgi:hypothetical protein